MRKLFTFIFLSLFILFYPGCKKKDSFQRTETPKVIMSTTEEKFFNLHRSNDPIEKTLVEFLKRQNEKLHFVEKTVKQIGFPRWDKAIQIKKDKARANGRGPTDSDTIFYIPFVRDSQNYVNASMVIKTSPSDTTFSYLCDWQYSRLPNSATSIADSAEHFAIFFMVMDKLVFGYTKFSVVDTSLFRKGDLKPVYVSLDTNANNRGRANLYEEVTYCQPVTVWFEDCTFVGHSACTPTCDRCYQYCMSSFSYEYCWTGYVDTGGGGGTGGSGTGSTGGGGGSGGGTGTPPDCNTPSVARVMINEGCGSGWTPAPTPVNNNSTHLTSILNLNSAQTSWLLQNPLVAQEIEKALQESLSDENPLTGFPYMDVYPGYAVSASRITIDAAMNGFINGPYNSVHFNLIKQNITNWQNSSITDPVFWALFNIQCTLIKIEHPEYNRWRVYWEAMGEVIHLGLDLAGLIPVIGEIADLTNGVIYTIEGNGVDAALSYASAIPFAGWFSAGVKFAKKGIALADGTKTTLKWIKRTNNLIDFGDRGQLRKVLGLTKGDARAAHHLMPWEHCGDELVQKAAQGKDAFHMNELFNGIPLTAIQHNGSHALYNQKVKSKLIEIVQQGGGINNFTPDFAAQKLRDLSSKIKIWINAHPNETINNIVL